MSGAWQWFTEACEHAYWRAAFMFVFAVLPTFAAFCFALGMPTWWPFRGGRDGGHAKDVEKR